MTASERTQFWEEQLAAWQRSGLSGQAFCETHSLVYHQFTYWRKKLVTDSGRSVPSNSLSSSMSGSGFTRVTRMMESSVTQSESDSQLTVSLPGGIAITGLHARNVSLLGDILRQL